MAIDPTLAEPKFHPWSDEERRTAALKIVEQLRENRRLAGELKDGKDRLEKLLAQFQAGGVERDMIEDQPELPLEPRELCDGMPGAPPLEVADGPGEPEPPRAA